MIHIALRHFNKEKQQIPSERRKKSNKQKMMPYKIFRLSYFNWKINHQIPIKVWIVTATANSIPIQCLLSVLHRWVDVEHFPASQTFFWLFFNRVHCISQERVSSQPSRCSRKGFFEMEISACQSPSAFLFLSKFKSNAVQDIFQWICRIWTFQQ